MPQTKMPIIGPQWQSSYAANVAGSSWIMIETSEKLETIDLPTPAGRPALAARVVGDGPSFALFHGGFGSWTHWIRNVEPLAGKFRMLAFDLPGYGNSPDVPPETTPDDYIEWVAAAVAHATPDGCHLAGFSFGGALAARVAVRLRRPYQASFIAGAGGFGVPVGRVIAQEKMPGPEGGRDARRAVAGRNLGQWMLSRAPRRTIRSPNCNCRISSGRVSTAAASVCRLRWPTT
ncbi:MAG: alpha/beta fold hydrolase [Pseudolabrys sp.]